MEFRHSLAGAEVVPTQIVLHGQSRVLEIHFATGEQFRLPFEFLRVHSPSAEVQGHGAGQEVLQTGKRGVDIVSLEPVGHYGIKPVFDDGHASGIFSWQYLFHLGQHQQALWQAYEERLRQAGASRDAALPVADAGTRRCHSGAS